MVLGSADLVILCFFAFGEKTATVLERSRRVSLDSSLYCVLRVLATGNLREDLSLSSLEKT